MTPATNLDEFEGQSLSGRDSLTRNRRVQATLLAVVWVLPALWCAGHVVAHELESGHHDHATAASDGFTGMSENHDHGHAHPEPEPAVSSEGAKKLVSLALLAVGAVFAFSTAAARFSIGTAKFGAARLATAIAGPRAPPIS